MRKCVDKIRKSCVCLTLALVSSLAFAQEADDGFIVPLNEDFSKAVSAAPAQASTAGNSSVAQGAWIELTSSNKAIIRDIATNEKSGYEFDNSHLLSNLNWWFWGDITPSFHLDAEISVYDFDKTIYQSNSYADNDPTVSWKDGFHELYSMPFSFMHNGNDNTVGSFNKFGFTLINPYFETKIGYGKLKAGGMLDFDGIYHVIDRWESVEKGFTELSLGKDLQKIGDFTVNATAALSMMRGTYGLYDLLDVKYGDEKATTTTRTISTRSLHILPSLQSSLSKSNSICSEHSERILTLKKRRLPLREGEAGRQKNGAFASWKVLPVPA